MAFHIDKTRGVAMERLIEPVTIVDPDGGAPEVRRARFTGPRKGPWWAPPGQALAEGEELWLVEGCIDARTLALAGLKAAAILSAGNYPDKALAALPVKPALVWALDNDPAGTGAILRHAARAAGFARAAALAPGRGDRGRDGRAADWNDECRAGRLGEADLAEARHRGALLLADSAEKKGVIVWAKTGATAFPLEFAEQTHWRSLADKRFEAALDSGPPPPRPASRASPTAPSISRTTSKTP